MVSNEKLHVLYTEVGEGVLLRGGDAPAAEEEAKLSRDDTPGSVDHQDDGGVGARILERVVAANVGAVLELCGWRAAGQLACVSRGVRAALAGHDEARHRAACMALGMAVQVDISLTPC